MKVVTVVQPWLPSYRLPFFGRAREILGGRGVDLRIVHGQPTSELRERDDAVSAPWVTETRARHLAIGGRYLTWQPVPRMTWKSDLVIVEQAIRNLENYLLMAFMRGRIAFWGHGRTYTDRPSRLEKRVKSWSTERGAWFFAYTDGGRRHLVDSGFPADRVTVLNNTIDDHDVRVAQRDLRAQDVERARRQWGLSPGVTAIFIGVIDPPKRPALLLDVGRRVARDDPGFRLLVAGRWRDEQLLREAAEQEPWLRLVGRADARAKALLGAVGDLLLMPGRVGLVAVDSFLLEVPIVTTVWPLHAPEFEYLVDGENAIVADDDAESVAEAGRAVIADAPLHERLVGGCRAAARTYTLERSVDAFVSGVEAALAAGTRRRS